MIAHNCNKNLTGIIGVHKIKKNNKKKSKKIKKKIKKIYENETNNLHSVDRQDCHCTVYK